MASGIVRRTPGRPGAAPFVPATPAAAPPPPGITQRGGGSGIVVRESAQKGGQVPATTPKTPTPVDAGAAKL
ncbi:MAG TPA: hypothetical protein VNM48_03540 [Chloroflexota bacterium]|nr:hypothetical protein [Chloroflexota bacterium]